MRDTSVIEVDLGAVTKNVAALRRLTGPDVAICPVIKANGYGLGAVAIARHLDACGVEMLAVYTRAEVIELLQAGLRPPILTLVPIRDLDGPDGLLAAVAAGRVHLSVHDADQLARLERIAVHRGIDVSLHLDVDTGMGRGGCALDEAPGLLARIAASPHLTLAGLATHFASSESEVLTGTQRRRFETLLADAAPLIPPTCLVHAANTVAAITDTRLHRRMVRVGQAWAGFGPEAISGSRVLPAARDLSPCVRWSSSLVHIKRIDAGSTVGYGATWTARRPSIIGLVPVGYADGYPLALSSGEGPAGQVDGQIDGQIGICPVDHDPVFARVVGCVNMDQVTVDLTDFVGAGHVAEIGLTVELISPDPSAPNHLPRLAAAAGTSLHELLCRLNPGIERVYRRPTSLIEVVAGMMTNAVTPAVRCLESSSSSSSCSRRVARGRRTDNGAGHETRGS